MFVRRFALFFRAAVFLGCTVHALAASLDEETAGPVALDRVTVLGSRVSRSEAGGAAAASVYDRDFIDATGVHRLADLLNLLPQNYGGAGSGRGSAPNDLNPEFGLRTETRAPPFNFILGAANVSLGQSGVSGANLRGLGSGSTLVLIDGRRQPIAGQGNRSTDSRQGFFDLNTIALGMVERVEVLTDAASALYGSDAIGGVINVVLKKNYTGAELTTRYRGAFEGGASERQATLGAGFTSRDGRLRGSLTADIYSRGKLAADERAFSREQDHRDILVRYADDGTPVYGTDLRIGWGYPAVVQARSGVLNGVVSADGSAVPVALVPEGARSTPLAGEFIPGQIVLPATGMSARNQRRTNTAGFLALVPPQESRSVAGTIEYDLNPRLRVYATAAVNRVTGRFDAQPPVSTTAASTGFGAYSTVVPAMIGGQPNALNPFGQDVMVGLIHAEFGPTQQTTRTLSRRALVGLTGLAGEDWSWDANVSWAKQRFAERNRTLDPGAFTAALAAPNLAERFNPFVDARAAGGVHAALYETMAATSAFDGGSELAAANFIMDGPVRALPGGDLRMAVGGEFNRSRHEAFSRSAVGVGDESKARRTSHAGFVELSIPVFGRGNARPMLRRLDVQLAGRHEYHGAAGDSTDPRVGVAWSPFDSVRLRGSVSTGFRAPALTEYGTVTTTETHVLTDPRRTPASTPGVVVRRGSNAQIEPETSRTEMLGLVLTPWFAEGLSLKVDYHRTWQYRVIQRPDPQAMLFDEARFADRVTRRAPTAEDKALGQPGELAAVDATFINFGEVRNESVDVTLSYDLPWRQLGRFRTSIHGTHTSRASVALRPGDAPVDQLGDTAAPPRWRWLGVVWWSGEPWAAAVFVNHIGGFESNGAGNVFAPGGYPAHTTMTLTASRVFEAGLWRGVGKGTKLGVSIGNVFDRAPPFSDTIFGFNGGLHSPLGRTYEVSLRVPF